MACHGNSFKLNLLIMTKRYSSIDVSVNSNLLLIEIDL